MSDGNRQYDDVALDALTERMIASARTERLPPRSKQRAAAAVGIVAPGVLASGVGTTSGAAAAVKAAGAAALGSTGMAGIGAAGLVKWSLLGVVTGAIAIGLGQAVFDGGHRAAPRAGTVASTAPMVKSTHDARSSARAETAMAAIEQVPRDAVHPSAEPASTVARSTAKGEASGARNIAVTTNVDAPIAALAGASSSSNRAEATSDTRSLGVELLYLETARRALAEGNAARALRVLDDCRASVKSPVLTPEADVLRMQAFVKAGDTVAAAREAGDFLVRHPHSPYAERVRGIIDAAPRTNP